MKFTWIFHREFDHHSWSHSAWHRAVSAAMSHSKRINHYQLVGIWSQRHGNVFPQNDPAETKPLGSPRFQDRHKPPESGWLVACLHLCGISVIHQWDIAGPSIFKGKFTGRLQNEIYGPWWFISTCPENCRQFVDHQSKCDSLCCHLWLLKATQHHFLMTNMFPYPVHELTATLQYCH